MWNKYQIIVVRNENLNLVYIFIYFSFTVGIDTGGIYDIFDVIYVPFLDML